MVFVRFTFYRTATHSKTVNMSSSRKPSADVLRRIKEEARQIAEVEYRSNQSKNKSAFISRQTARHYTRLLKKHYEDGERSKRSMQSSNANMRAGNAHLRSHISNLSSDLQFHELSRKLDDRRRR